MTTNQKTSGPSVLDFIAEKMMEAQIRPIEKLSSPRKFSVQMRAVLLVFNADPYLMEAAAPFVNFEAESIYWDKILRLPLSSGQKSAIQWAYSLWTDEKPKGNCFAGALNMSSHIQVAVLEALCLRWGLRG